MGNPVTSCTIDHQALKTRTSMWRAGTVLLPHLGGAEWEWAMDGIRYQSRNCAACGSTVSARIDRLGRVVPPSKFQPGQQFGKWTLIEFDSWPKALVRCECGVERSVFVTHLQRGASTSCGKCGDHRSARTHGATNTAEFRIWMGMRARCKFECVPAYRYYGGRGIKVCDEWEASFERFFADMGPRPSVDHSIDRIDTNGNYEPSNCRWATRSEQSINRRCTKKLTVGDRTQSLAEWSREIGVALHTLAWRRQQGWSPERIISQDVATPNRRTPKALTVNGRTQTLSQWAKEIGIGVESLRHRIARGWSHERAVTEAVHLNHGRGCLEREAA